MLHTTINYLSYFLIPLLFLLIYLIIRYRDRLLKKKLLLILSILSIPVLLLFIYARFVEPNTVKVRSSDIEVGFKTKIVLIADTHIGVYSNKSFFKKVVNKINSIEEVDAVVLAGDITYNPKREDILELLAPLKDIKYPVIAVLGNHDIGHPGPDIEEDLELALKRLGVIYLKNDSVKIEGNDDITFLGLADLWSGDVNIEKLNSFDDKENLIVIAHNPDTVYKYNKNIPDLTLSGHTHGGQIRLPLIYEHFIPSRYGFNEGFYNIEKGKIFVTSGLGQTGLPFRIGIKPVVDILNLY